MTLSVEVDLDKIKVNQDAKSLGQKSFNSKVNVRTDTEPIRPLKLLVKMLKLFSMEARL